MGPAPAMGPLLRGGRVRHITSLILHRLYGLNSSGDWNWFKTRMRRRHVWPTGIGSIGVSLPGLGPRRGISFGFHRLPLDGPGTGWTRIIPAHLHSLPSPWINPPAAVLFGLARRPIPPIPRAVSVASHAWAGAACTRPSATLSVWRSTYLGRPSISATTSLGPTRRMPRARCSPDPTVG